MRMWRRIWGLSFQSRCWEIVTSRYISYATLSLVLLSSCGQSGQEDSCHNPFRDGSSSATPVVVLFLPITLNEWEALKDISRTYASQGHLDFKDYSISGKDYRVLEFSMCDESGLRIKSIEQRWRSRDFKPTTDRDGIYLAFFVGDRVHTPRAVWRTRVVRFIEMFRDEWPARQLQYVGSDGNFITRREAIGDST